MQNVHGQTSSDGPRTGAGAILGPQDMCLVGPSGEKMSAGRNGTSALRRRANRSSDALKDPLIRRAVSTLVYATLLYPIQALLPVSLHPPESAGLGAGGLAGALPAAGMLEQIQP